MVQSVASPGLHAQTFDSEIESMIETMDISKRVAQTRGPVQAPLVLPANLEVHWRLWKQVTASGQWNTVPLEALRDDARSLGYHSLPVHAMSLVATARSPEVRAQGSSQVQEYYAAAQTLAPDLPYPYLDQAAYLVREDPAAMPTILRAALIGMEKSWRWLDTRATLELSVVVLALMAMLVAGFLFLFTQLMRYFGIAAYDAARLLPRGFSSPQAVILLAALVVVPGLLLQSPLLSLLILLALVSVFQQVDERIVTILLFGTIAVLPLADRHLSTLVTYPGSEAQAVLHAQHVYCDAPCRTEIARRIEAAEIPSDVLLYTHWLAQARTGQPALWEPILADIELRGSSSAIALGYVDNLRGAILVAQGKADEAIPYLERARQNMPSSSAAPSYNLMRAYQAKNDAETAELARGEAISRDLYAVLARSSASDRPDMNSALFLEPLAPALIWDSHQRSERPSLSLIEPAWTALAGKNVPLSWAFLLGVLGMLIAIGTVGLRLGQRTSTPCPRCGLARDPDDGDKMGHHHYCYPCYRTYVAPGDLDYDARVHNEEVLGRRSLLQIVLRRFFSLILPGAGHALAGQALVGFGVLFCLTFFALWLMQPPTLWRAPFEFFSASPLGARPVAWFILGLCVLVGLFGAIRDIAPTIVRKKTIVGGPR